MAKDQCKNWLHRLIYKLKIFWLIRFGKCDKCGICCTPMVKIGEQTFIDLSRHCPFLMPINEKGERLCGIFKQRPCGRRTDILNSDWLVPASCKIAPRNYKHAPILQAHLRLEARLGLKPFPVQSPFVPENPVISRLAAADQPRRELIKSLKVKYQYGSSKNNFTGGRASKTSSQR